jgi:hypothetical protein
MFSARTDILPAADVQVMKPLPCNNELLDVARSVIWFEPPGKALADPVRFLACLMTYGTAEDIAVVRRYLDLDDFREALERAPPAIIDARPWACWNVMTARHPVPPMPRRITPDKQSFRARSGRCAYSVNCGRQAY